MAIGKTHLIGDPNRVKGSDRVVTAKGERVVLVHADRGWNEEARRHVLLEPADGAGGTSIVTLGGIDGAMTTVGGALAV
jgi:hypothetical protein